MSLDIATVTGVIIIAIIITGAVGNCLTLFVFYRYDPLRDVTGLFLANLAVADLLQSVIGMPLIATSAFYEEWVFGEILCTISGATNSLFCITSVLTLTAVSVDRYLAIVHPLEYPTWLSMKRSKMVVVCLWLMAFFAALLPVLGWSRYVFHIEHCATLFNIVEHCSLFIVVVHHCGTLFFTLLNVLVCFAFLFAFAVQIALL